MNRLLSLLALALFVSVTAAAATAQRGPRVSAQFSSGVIKLGATTRLLIEVEGAEDARLLTLPEVEGLVIDPPGRPARQEFTRIFNGRQYSKVTLRWSLSVRATETGEFIVPGINIVVDSREMRTGELLLKVVRDLRGDELGFFEIVNPPEVVYEGQPFTIDLRFGWDKSLPVTSIGLLLPWWDNLLGTLEVESGPRNLVARYENVPINERVKVQAEYLTPVTRGGSEFRVLQLRRTYLPTRSGKLEFSTSYFEFSQLVARARSLFENDKTEDFYAVLPGFEVEVRTIPETGRPFEWTGAVGDLASSRRVDRRDVDEGDSIKLTVSWVGEGNLEFFDAPELGRLDEFRGFRVLGTESEFLGDERRVTYDLVPTTAELTEIPPVPLWTFDPKLERYRKVETEPVDIRVRELEGFGLADVDGDSTAADIRDIQPRPREDPPLRGPGGGALLASALALPFLWMIGRVMVRRRGHPDAPSERRRRAARRNLARELRRAQSAEQQGRAFYHFLAARTREPDQAWVGRDPAGWRGPRDETLAPDEVEALRKLCAELDEQTYASANGSAIEAARILAVADRLVKGGL